MPDSSFREVVNGSKKFELRADMPRWSRLKIGHPILFRPQSGRKKIVVKEVSALLRYPTFEDLVSDIGFDNLGLNTQTAEETLSKLYSVCSKELVEKYGALGIKIRDF